MSSPQPPNLRLVWLGLVIVAGLVAATVVVARRPGAQRLPPPPILNPVADFTLTNQLAQPVTGASLRGRVWIANIIFSRCPGPCPVLTRQMAELVKSIPPSSPVSFLTLTTDPEFDTPSVLKRFGEPYSSGDPRWHFLTGPKSDLVKVGVDSLKFIAVDKDAKERTSDADLFIHSTTFAVVDKRGNLRAMIESTDAGFPQRVGEVVDALLKEP